MLEALQKYKSREKMLNNLPDLDTLEISGAITKMFSMLAYLRTDIEVYRGL